MGSPTPRSWTPIAGSAASCSASCCLESAVRGAELSAVDTPLDEGHATIPNEDGRVDLSDKPTIDRLQSLLSEDRSAEEFEISLETLLDRLEMDLSQ